jgi:hypothetical protein
MNQQKRERLRHCAEYKSGLQPSTGLSTTTWGSAPCWYQARRWRSRLTIQSKEQLPT